MKIAILHFTMGLVNRGSEISNDLLASSLSRSHEVLVLQSGKIIPKQYKVIRIMPLAYAPPPAPGSFWEKILFRLHLNESSTLVRRFTHACSPSITEFKPDIIVAVNGSDQVKILRQNFPTTKIVVFGRAGIGHDDASNLRAGPDLFIAPTHVAEIWAKKIASKHTHVTIPNPIDLVTHHRTKPYNHKLKSPVVLIVGALSKYKNIDVAVAAAMSTSCSILLVGGGEEREKISALLNNYPDKYVWLNSVDPAQMPSIYKSANLFCFVPDKQEAFGRVYIEAMAAKLPIVASDDPIRREIIGAKGVFVNPHNVRKVAQGIKRAIKLGKVAYTDELEKYSLPVVTKAIEKEFHEILTRG